MVRSNVFDNLTLSSLIVDGINTPQTISERMDPSAMRGSVTALTELGMLQANPDGSYSLVRHHGSLTLQAEVTYRTLVEFCPFDSFGKGKGSEHQTFLGDTLDWVRDQIGRKDFDVAALLLAHHAISHSYKG